MEVFQHLLFSSSIDIQLIRTKITELINKYSDQTIDHQLILAFSLDYQKIPLFLPFLSEPRIEENSFIHFDQELLFNLLQNNISFPISIISKYSNVDDNSKIILEKNLYEELKKQNKLNEIKGKSIEIREKTKIEEIIEKDDIDKFRLISNENNFDFNGRIKKENQLFKYSEIPIILYCIEKNAIKCFKYALINGADPSQKSIYRKGNQGKDKEIWDGYGFAGAIGNIQIIKLIEDQGIQINKNLMKGASKFHQNHLIRWAEKNHNQILKDGVKETIKFENYEGFDIIYQNLNNINATLNDKDKLPIHYAAKDNSKEIFELLLSKGANIHAKDIIYQIIKLLFLINLI